MGFRKSFDTSRNERELTGYVVKTVVGYPTAIPPVAAPLNNPPPLGVIAHGVGRFAAGLHVAFYLRRGPAGQVVSVHRELRPDLGEAGEALVRAGLFELAGRALPWSQVAAELLAAV